MLAWMILLAWVVGLGFAASLCRQRARARTYYLKAAIMARRQNALIVITDEDMRGLAMTLHEVVAELVEDSERYGINELRDRAEYLIATIAQRKHMEEP